VYLGSVREFHVLYIQKQSCFNSGSKIGRESH
jgi:hypothetical protein